MMTALPARWWTLPPEQVETLEITGQPECMTCGGLCCSDRIARPLAFSASDFSDPAAVTIADLQARMAPQGIPWEVTGYHITEAGEFAPQYRCRLGVDGPCREEEKCPACRRWPLVMVTQADDVFAQVAWCPLARRLREEWLTKDN